MTQSMDLAKTYRFAPGFSCRRESFGGILYHFEGRAPDPRLYFVDSSFLVDLLEMVEAAPLGSLLEQAAGHFRLDARQRAAMEGFFARLVQKEALVPK